MLRLAILLLCLIPTAAAQPVPGGFSALIPSLLPSVVNIYVKKIDEKSDPLKPKEKPVFGSGFVIDPSGVIVTSEHVIENAFHVSVVLQDNTRLTARLLAASAPADIALLQINAARPLPPVKFGDSSKLRMGDRVYAVGNPLGFGGSVSAGIISALNRDIRLSPYDDYIQTDAAINHGNSGGPLFNAAGEVVGVSTALLSPTGETGSVGLGFAKPINEAAFVIGQLRQYGYVRAGYLGANIQQVTSDIADSLTLPEVTGALVNGIEPGGPADKAGLRQGDIILRVGDRDTPDTRTVARAFAQAPLGKVLNVTLWRDTRQQTVAVTVLEWPGDRSHTPLPPIERPQPTPDLGLRLAAMSEALRHRYRMEASQHGVVVTGVAPLSPADDRGVREGEVIASVQMQAVNAPEDVLRDFDALRRQGLHHALVLLLDADGARTVALPLDSGA